MGWRPSVSGPADSTAGAGVNTVLLKISGDGWVQKRWRILVRVGVCNRTETEIWVGG